MMGWMVLLLLQLHLAACDDLPAPSNVTISSLNMEHLLSFLPGPQTPPSSRFAVEKSNSRKGAWKPVAGCSRLTAGQTCNLTRVFRDLHDQYQARVRAFTSNRTSDWTMSRWFLPLKDTVMGPPDVSVSGCGNCLRLQLRPPATRQHQLLVGLHRELFVHVQRTRDGAEFSLSLPYKEEVGLAYLQRGVEYCLRVTIRTRLNNNSVASEPHCAFTSPPPPTSSVHLLASVAGGSCALLLVFGPLAYSGRLNVTLPRRRRVLPNFLLWPDLWSAAPQLSDQASVSANPLLDDQGPCQPPRNGSDQDEDAGGHA